jgi:hypothetical protein
VKKVAAMLIFLCLLSLSAVCVGTVTAQYQGNIVINADGSVTPSTAPIRQTDKMYTLTSDVIGDIVVEANNIILDGKGYTLLGGVSLAHVSNVTVKGFVITNTAIALQTPMIGIALTNVSNAVITNNVITGIESILAMNGGIYAGIYVEGGNSNTITENNLTNNLNGLGFLNTFNNRFVGNNITGQQIFLYLHTRGIWFVNSSNNMIYYNNIVNCTYQAQVSDSINVWDDGYLGNYWSD